MARKALKLTEKKIADMIQAGRGQGEGADYQPWIQVGNFSSEGRGHRIADIHIPQKINSAIMLQSM